MKKRLAGKILASLLVVLVGINTLALPVTHAKTPNPQTTPNTEKSLDKLTVEELLPLAQAGDTSSQFNLGFIYYKGEGIPQDYQKAAYWWQKVAEQGYSGAQNNLGAMYEKGQGKPQDYQKAVYWYQKSAEQGYSEAQNNLGTMYEKGQGVPQDDQKAVYWYQKSAEQGFAQAQSNLGVMYGVGRGVPQDYQRAYVWFNLAAAQGEENALKGRDLVAKELTPAQLTQAQQWARGWHEKIQAKKAQTSE